MFQSFSIIKRKNICASEVLQLIEIETFKNLPDFGFREGNFKSWTFFRTINLRIFLADFKFSFSK